MPALPNLYSVGLWAPAAYNLRKVARFVPSVKQQVAELPQERQAHAVNELHIDLEVQINASTSDVFHALTQAVDGWWAFRTSGSTVTLEPVLGGRWYEETADADDRLWGTVTRIKPMQALEVTGSIGMAGPAVNVVSYILEPTGGGTTLQLSHHGIGLISDGYKEGWDELLSTHLKRFVEEGTRFDAKAT